MEQRNSTVEIFCCYARKDKKYLTELKSHLGLLLRQNSTNERDHDISAGTEWEQEVKKHLNDADIILLLISPDFNNSDYCYNTMERSLERHEKGTIVIPVPLRPFSQQNI